MQAKDIRRFPDVFNKDEKGNLNKLLLIFDGWYDRADVDLAELDLSRGIKSARGKTLNLFGADYDQKRGRATDDQYRSIILARIQSYTAGGDYESTVSAIVALLQANGAEVNRQDIAVEEMDNPMTIRITRIPLSVLISTGLSTRQVHALIKMMLPICSELILDSFDGTFEFSSVADEYDENAGFANDAQTIGGYLGLTPGEENPWEIPI